MYVHCRRPWYARQNAGQHFLHFVLNARWRGGATGRALDLRSTGRGFEYMRGICYLAASSKNSDSSVRSLTLISLQIAKFRRFEDVFSWFFLSNKLKELPYFYFRFIWPTNPESMQREQTPSMIICTKFEVDMTICCRVTALLMRTCYVTLWPWPLTFWP